MGRSVGAVPPDDDEASPLILWQRAAELSRLALGTSDRAAAARLRSMAAALVRRALQLERTAGTILPEDLDRGDG
jgi:hypothetical protein